MLGMIPVPYRILAMVFLLLGGIAFGYTNGLSRESDRRDAQDAAKERQAAQAFQRAVENGRKHAKNVIEWRKKAQTYYQQWQEELNNVPDNQLAECSEQPANAHVVLLTGSWVRLYDAAWLPGIDQSSDTGGASYALVEAGAVTPREVLANVQVNAGLCADDRKRLDELIDHLTEISKGKQ